MYWKHSTFICKACNFYTRLNFWVIWKRALFFLVSMLRIVFSGEGRLLCLNKPFILHSQKKNIVEQNNEYIKRDENSRNKLSDSSILIGKQFEILRRILSLHLKIHIYIYEKCISDLPRDTFLPREKPS